MRKCYFLFFIGNLPAFRKLYIKTTLFLLILLGFTIQPGYAQPGTQWEFSRNITLSPATPMADFQVRIELNGVIEHAHMKSDGSDLRFYVGAGNIQCSYWIERFNPAGNSVIWVKVPTSGTTGLTMYYGNPAAVKASNGENTFDFFDGFDGTSLNTSLWTNNSETWAPGTITVSGGEVNLANKGGYTSMYAKYDTTNFSDSYIVELKHKETGYFRNRFYVTDSMRDIRPTPAGIETGLWSDTEHGSSTGYVQWSYYSYINPPVTANTDYLMRWDITRSTGYYEWSNYNYNTNIKIEDPNNKFDPIQFPAVTYLNISVSDNTYNSTIVDWARIRKAGTSEVIGIGNETVRVSVPSVTSVTPLSGCEGEIFTITGDFQTNFGRIVKIGSTPVEIVTENATTITAKFGKVSGNLSVETTAGTSSGTFAMTATALPIVTAGASPNPICTQGTSAALGGTVSGGTGVWSANVTGTFNIIAGGFSNTTWTAPAGFSGQVIFTLTGTNGTCSATATKTMMVNETPTGTVSVSGDKDFCIGESITFTAPSGYTGYEYLITQGTSTTVDNGSNPVYTANNLQPGATVKVRVTNYNCNAILDTEPFTVSAIPSGNFTSSDASGNTPNDQIICKGEAINFIFSDTNFLKYAFILNGTDTLQNTNVNYLTNVTNLENGDKMTLLVTGTGGCTKLFGPITVTVHNNPTGTLTSNKAGDAICLGGNLTFTASAGFVNYEFLLNGGTSLQGPSGTRTYTSGTGLVNNDEISVKVKDINGCYANIDTVLVTVHDLPAKPIITYGSQPTSFCVGGGRNITLSVAGNPGDQYQWFKNGSTYGSLGTNTTLGPLTLVSDVGSYTVSLVNANGCPSPVSDPVVVTIYPEAAKPVVTVSSGQLTFCVGSGSVTLSSSSASTYQWYFGTTTGNLSPIPGEINQTITLTDVGETGYYAVGITNANGCAGSALSTETFVTVNPLPTTPVITVIGNPTYCVGENVTFSAPASASYRWYKDGVLIPGATSQNLTTAQTMAAAGVYTVEVKNSNNCWSNTSAGETVIVNPLPEPDIIGPGTICLGTTGNEYRTEAGMSGYVWSATGGGTITSGSTTNTILVDWSAVPGVRNLNVFYTDGNGCRSNTQAAFTNSPTVKPTITGDKQVCVGSSQIEYTTEGGDNKDYDWTVSGGGTITSGSTTNTIKISWSIAGPQTVSVNYTNKDNCNAPSPTVYTVTVNPIPIADFNYSGTPYCSNSGLVSPLMGTGAKKGTFSFSPSGLVINTGSGEINTAASIPGTYTVTNTVAASGGCSTVTATAQVTITKLPTATLSYAGSPFCSDDNSLKTVTLNGTNAYTNGIFTANSGLSLDLNSGAINPSLSTPGTYEVTYTVPATAGCPEVVVTTPIASRVIITALPTVSLAYTNNEYCKSDNIVKSPNLTGTGTYTGGTYTVNPTSGLAINPTSGSFTPSAATPGVYTITYTTPASAGCHQVSQTFNVTITSVPTAVIAYSNPTCNTGTTLPVTLTGTGAFTGGLFTSSPTGLSINTSTGLINPSTSTAGTYIVTYTIYASGGCAAVPVTTTVTISPKPEVSAGTNWSTCVGAPPVNITQGADTAFASSVLWTGGAGTWSQANSLTNATYLPAPGETGVITLTLTATGRNGCTSNTSIATKTLTINTIPAPVNIIPTNALALCVGGIQSFVSVKNNVSDFTLGPLMSSTNSQDIPDNSTTGVSKAINISGIPNNAVITSVDINFTVPHSFNGDLTINLKAANNKVLNIANSLSGPGFINTIISSTSTNPIQTSGDIGPFTGTYAAQMRYGTQGATSVPGNRAFARSFDELFNAPNGNWILSVRDGGTGDYGTFNSWSITIKYSIPNDPIPVLWRSTIGDTIPDNLYLDASATIPYTGDAQAVVYASPSEAGTYNYTATSLNQEGCKATKDFTLNISPSPQVYIKADYCENAADGKITLYAMGVDNPTSYNWSTGQTTSSVLVDIAHEYYVSVTNSQGCTGTGVLSVAEELVVNGDFELGNTGFQTDYVHMPSPNPKHPIPPVYTGLVNEGTYAVDTSAYVYHQQFHGRDHTTSEQKGKFLMVNGKAGIRIWEQTVSVLPNTDYYFSAWAMNFSGIGSTTELQFEVNGVPVGTIAKLANVPPPTNEEDINISNWVRFYNGNTNGIDNTWNSGENTEAIIRIVNLSNEESGNDFGLDDISFGTLAPFVSGPDISGRNEQTICVGESIQPIVYKVGSGDEPAVVLPPEFIRTFDGLNYTISGGVNVEPGDYEYVLTTTGSCPIPATATGKITVRTNPEITLTSTTTDGTLCLNSNLPAPISFKVMGFKPGDNAVFSGLPAGINGVYNSTSGIASISGAASITGSFNYKLKTESICKADSISGVIVVDTPPIAGILTSDVVCLNGSGNVRVAGYSGTILGWASSDDGINYTPIANNTNTEGFTNITQTRYYKVNVGNGVCPAVSSVPIAATIQNLWEGKSSSDWSNPFNWSSQNVPALSTAVCGGTVTIPKVVGINNDPVLTTTAGVTHLNVLAGGNLLIQSGGNLQVAGNITNSGIINARNGGIEYTGNTDRTIQSNIFLNNAIGDLKISTSHNNGVSLNAPIDIYRSLTFGTDGKKLITNDQLTLKSTKEETASVGNLTGKTIIGNVTVERYINTGTTATGGHRKSWQLLATPTQGQSIKDSWQEGAVSTGETPIKNPNPGYGTLLTTGYNNVPANGFDLYTAPGPSIKTYVAATGGYDQGPTSTNDPIYNSKGYLVLVRGDRSVYTYNATAKPTTLRTKGTLLTGTQPVLNFTQNTWNSVGNPYASAIDLNSITINGGVKDVFAVWDPLSTGDYGLGGFTYLVKSGSDFIAVPSSPSYPGSQPIYIQSGQAFMVQTAPAQGGSIQFTENAKVSGSRMVMRGQKGDGRISQLRANLYGLDKIGSATISDGILLQFAEDLSNEIDGMDARKMSNTSENLSIISNEIQLAIERRQPIISSDTIFLNLSGVRVQNYRFEFIANNLQSEGLQGFVEDTYLGQATPLNLEGSTLINFNIENKPGSYAPNRFRIVFNAAHGPLPVTFTGIYANQVKEDIAVTWNVENEINILGYDVEKSTNGMIFNKIAHLSAKSLNSYNWLDKNVEAGNHYYRVKAINVDGKTELTPIVKVQIQSKPARIAVYPNPITNGVVKVHLINQPPGKYKIRLLNPVGQVIVNKIVTHGLGNSIHAIDWDYKLARGLYQIEVTKPDGGVNIIKVVY